MNLHSTAPPPCCCCLLACPCRWQLIREQMSVPLAFWRLPFLSLLQLMQWRPSTAPLPIWFPWHHSPPAKKGALKGHRCLQCFLYIAYIMLLLLLARLVDWLPYSMTLFCSSSVDSHDPSVPVRLFSPLVPVYLVSLLHFSVPSGVSRLPWSGSGGLHFKWSQWWFSYWLWGLVSLLAVCLLQHALCLQPPVCR